LRTRFNGSKLNGAAAPRPTSNARRRAGLKEKTMADINEILGQIPVDQIAGLLGTDRASAQAAVEAAVPALLAGMKHNASAPAGAASLESALGQHLGETDGNVDVSRLNVADGEKIVGHVMGGQQDQVAHQLAGAANLGGAGGDLVRRLLPILAPIVMSYLARKVLGDRAGGTQGQAPGGIDLGSILGGILGGGMPGGTGAGGTGAGFPGAGQGGGLGDILGGLFGGGPESQQASTDVDRDAGPQLERRSDIPGNSSAVPRPGELVDVDFPGKDQGPDERAGVDDQKQAEHNQAEPDQPERGAGLDDLLGGLFGKKK
jgi:hypothetical protein